MQFGSDFYQKLNVQANKIQMRRSNADFPARIRESKGFSFSRAARRGLGGRESLGIIHMRVLMVEEQAQTGLAGALAARTDIESLELAGDAGEALDKLDKTPFDLLLLDINMPEFSGIELIERLKRNVRPLPSIMFVTGRDQQAVSAPDTSALTMEEPLQMQRVPRPSPRIAIKAKGRIVFIDPCAVIAVQAEGNYVLLLREGGSHLLRESISDMAEKLEPFGFIRIHRSVLVNAAFVEEIQPCQTGEYDLRMKGGKQFTVTRTYKKNLRSLAQYWIGTGAFLAD
jgi:DNA-binding LytR/AlgR family response regulator